MEKNVSYTGSIDTGQFVVGFALTGFACLFGLVINVCVYLVVLQIKVLCRYMWYLLSLTFYDWLFCLSGLVHLVLPAYCAYFHPEWLIRFINSYPFLRIADTYIFSALQCAEIWITVALTHDRFWLICQPIESGSLFDKRRTKKTICVVSIVAMLYNIPKIIFMSKYMDQYIAERDHQNYSTTNMSTNIATEEILRWESPDLICLSIQDKTAKWGYCFVYNTVFDWLLLHILPTLALCIYNLKLFLKVQVAKRHLCQVSTLKKGNKDSFWATVNIIALVIFFIVCQTPAFVFKVCAFCGKATYNGMLYQVTSLILIINSAANFVVYVLIFELFRRLAMSFFCGRNTGKEETDQVSRTCSSNTFARRSRPVKMKYVQEISNGSFHKKQANVTLV